MVAALSPPVACHLTKPLLVARVLHTPVFALLLSGAVADHHDIAPCQAMIGLVRLVLAESVHVDSVTVERELLGAGVDGHAYGAESGYQLFGHGQHGVSRAGHHRLGLKRMCESRGHRDCQLVPKSIRSATRTAGFGFVTGMSCCKVLNICVVWASSILASLAKSIQNEPCCSLL